MRSLEEYEQSEVEKALKEEYILDLHKKFTTEGDVEEAMQNISADCNVASVYITNIKNETLVHKHKRWQDMGRAFDEFVRDYLEKTRYEEEAEKLIQERRCPITSLSDQAE